MPSDMDFYDIDDWESPDIIITASAVTGEDGTLLVNDIDLSQTVEVPASQKKDPPKFFIDTRHNTQTWQCQPPPRPPLRIRNKITGHEFDWSPLFTMNEDLEVIA